jgi:hypothetical protein
MRTAASEGSERKADRLTNFEFVLVHGTLPRVHGIAHHLCGRIGDFNCRLHAKHYYHEIALLGDFKGLHFVVYVASRLGEALCP